MSAGNWKDMFKGVQTGDIDLVEYYLSIGVDPNYQHPEFLAAPLVESIRFNNLEIAKLLLENGADPNIQEIWGKETPLSVAKATDNKEAIELIRTFIQASEL